jgi:hypothetical protein
MVPRSPLRIGGVTLALSIDRDRARRGPFPANESNPDGPQRAATAASQARGLPTGECR